MAKKRSKQSDPTRAKKKRGTKRRLRRLEQQVTSLEREHRRLTKRLEKLAVSDAGAVPFARPFAGPRAGGRGAPPWRKSFGPVVSLEVPLETDDPAAPLWATVAARLPEEITTVADDGTVSTYRYSAAGSTPQAPRYRQLREPSEAFPV